MTEHEVDTTADVNANVSGRDRDAVGIDGAPLAWASQVIPETVGVWRHDVPETVDRTVWQFTGVDVRNARTARDAAVGRDGRHPSEEYLSALAAGFGGFVRDEVERSVAQLGERVGSPTAEAAGWTSPPEGNDVMRGLAPIRHEAMTR